MGTDFLNEMITTFTGWISEILDFIQSSIIKAFSLDLSTFHDFIPNAKDFYFIFVGIGIGIVLFNFMWQSFKMMGLITGGEAEEPIPLITKSILYLILVGYAQDIFNTIINLGKVPYDKFANLELSIETIKITDLLDNLALILTGVLTPALPLVLLIIAIIIGVNYLKLLFEIAERYIILAILQFIAPICIAFGTNKGTKPIFDTYFRMLGGQILLLILHTWFLRMFLNMMVMSVSTVDLTNVVLWILFILGFLKTAQKLDTILAMLGFNTPKTGDTMLGEMLLAGRIATSGIGNGINSVGQNATDGANAVNTGVTGSIKRMADSTFLGKGISAVKQNQENKANKFSQSATTDNPTANQIKDFEKGINSENNYAVQGIGKIANGSYKNNGSITGANAVKAMNKYFGNSNGASLNNNSKDAVATNVTDERVIPSAVESSTNENADTQSLNENIGSENSILHSGDENVDTHSLNENIGSENSILHSDNENVDTQSLNENISSENSILHSNNNEMLGVETTSNQKSNYSSDLVDEMVIDNSDNADVIDNMSTENKIKNAFGKIASSFEKDTSIPSYNEVNIDESNIDDMNDTYTGVQGNVSSFEDDGNLVDNDISKSTNGNTVTVNEQEPINETITTQIQTHNVQQPKYVDLEIGGGKIRGFERGADETREFVMYSSEQFERPEGNYTTETSNDGVRWYKQYAEPTVIKTPTGKISPTSKKAIIKETIEYRLPKSPNQAPSIKR